MRPLNLAATLLGTFVMIGSQGCTTDRPAHPSLQAARSTAVFTTIQPSPGVERPCTIIMPTAPDGGVRATGMPAILFLHGRGECGADGVRSCAVGLPMAAIGDPARWPFVLIVPQKPESNDTWQQHEEYVLACLERACVDLALDRSRIYLTGLSQGGAGTWAIGADHPELFAAIAPVCGFTHAAGGGIGDARSPESAAARRAIAQKLVAACTPIWAFHGEKDDIVLPDQSRRFVAAVEAAGGTARATYFPDANHNAWDPAYRDRGAELSAWLLSHRLVKRN